MKKLLLTLMVLGAFAFGSNAVFACDKCNCETEKCPCACHQTCDENCACGCHKGTECDVENCTCACHKKCDENCTCDCHKAKKCDKNCTCGCHKKFKFKKIKCNCNK